MKSRFKKTFLSIAFSILGFSFFALPINALELNLKQENTEDRTYVFDVLATPSTEDDLAIQVDIYVADATIKEFKFNEALEVFGNIGTCNDEDSSIIYTQDRVCFAIASEKKFNQGDLLGELTVEAPESGIFTIVRTEGTVYTDGENKFSEEIVLFSNDAEIVGEAPEPQDLSTLTAIVIVTIVVILVLGTVVLYVNRAKIKNDKKLTVLAVIGLGSVLLIGAFSVSQLINSDLAPEDSHASTKPSVGGRCKIGVTECRNNRIWSCGAIGPGGSADWGTDGLECVKKNPPSTGGGTTTPRPPTGGPTPPSGPPPIQAPTPGCVVGNTECRGGVLHRCQNVAGTGPTFISTATTTGCGTPPPTQAPTPPPPPSQPTGGSGSGSTGGGGSQPTGGGGSGSTGGGSQPTGGGGSGSTGGGGGSTPAPTTSPSCGNLDQNRNGRIDDIVDFASFAIMYRRQCNNNFTPANRCGSKDTNRDGVIDIVDLGAFTRRRSSDPTCANV